MAEHVVRESDLARGRLAWLAFGIVGLAGGTALGWQGGVIDALVSPPAPVRAALVAVSVVLGLALLGRAIARIETGRGLASADLSAHDLAQLVRGVRYVFLAVAQQPAVAADRGADHCRCGRAGDLAAPAGRGRQARGLTPSPRSPAARRRAAPTVIAPPAMRGASSRSGLAADAERDWRVERVEHGGPDSGIG